MPAHGTIDNVKKVSDGFGPPSGDEILKICVTVPGKAVRDADSVARYGGEEFAIDNRGEKIGTITASASPSSASARTPQKLVQRTDAKLYGDECAGRNRLLPPNARPADATAGSAGVNAPLRVSLRPRTG